MFKKLISLILCVLLLVCVIPNFAGCTPNTESTNTNYNLTGEIEDGAILQCFCWDFETIINSLDDIAAAGFSAIQTSPINECLVGEDGGMQLYGDGKWYYHYQPTDFTIGNYQLGTRDEFKKLCKKADELGIKVVVDVVPNHTTPTTNQVNQNLIDAVGGFDKLYHKNSKYDISNWGNRLECTTYKMGGLPDINTENKKYQDYFIDFINDCIECGADGFRYDCAKHIALPDDPTESKGVKNNFWTRLTTEIKDADRIFNYGEVLQGSNDRLLDYIDTIGHSTVSSYGQAVRNAVMQNYIDTAFVEELKVGSNESVVTWVESHDNYINDGNWANMTEEQVILAWAIIASRSVGTPLFFDRPYGADIDNQWGTMNRIGTSGSYMYKHKFVREVNFFRNAMVGEEEVMSNPDPDSAALQICRGNKGSVIINLGEDLEVNFETDLADGTYVDRVDKETVYNVKDGIMTCDKPIPNNTVVVLYNEGYTEYATPAVVKISDDVSCLYSEDKIDVELQLENAETGTYILNDGKETEYKNGDTVTIKAKDGIDGINTLVLKAENSAGQKTYMKYYFTNSDNLGTGTTVITAEGDSVYFEKPDDWGDNINAYVYNNYEMQNAPWPGKQMEKDSDGKYKYTFDMEWEDAYIIFNDGTNQYPGANEPGVLVEKDKTYTVQ